MIKDFYEAWWFLSEHPHFEMKNKYFKTSMFAQSLSIDVQKVNPNTCSIDEDEKENTKVEIWLECGPQLYNEITKRFEPSHEVDLDCGGDTFEEAIINLANIVNEKYPKRTT